MMRIPSKFFLTGCSLLALTLCGCGSLPTFDSDARQTEVEDGDQTYRVASNDGALSPEEMHKRARERVEPNAMVQHNEYVKTVDQIEREKAEQTRIVELERDMDVVKTEFKGLKETVQVAEARTPDFHSTIEPAAAGTSVKDVRFGNHPNKVRMVFDLSGPSGMQYDLDNENKLLVVRIPGAGWDTAREQAFPNGQYFEGYAAKTTDEGDALIVLRLKRSVKVLANQKLGKNAAGYYRTFLDVAPL